MALAREGLSLEFVQLKPHDGQWRFDGATMKFRVDYGSDALFVPKALGRRDIKRASYSLTALQPMTRPEGPMWGLEPLIEPALDFLNEWANPFAPVDLPPMSAGL